MRNLPETPIIFLAYSPKSYFLAFWGAILIAISEINYIKQCNDWNYVHKHAYLGSRLTLTNAMRVVTQVALTDTRVITQDLVVSQNQNFVHNPSCSYVKPVLTRRGSTVYEFSPIF
jgi:hypothetical protein